MRPVRSPGGFRLYTAADAARVERMRRGLDEGLSAAEAARAALEDERPSEGLLDDAAARLLAAIRRYDEAAANSVLDESLAAFGARADAEPGGPPHAETGRRRLGARRDRRSATSTSRATSSAAGCSRSPGSGAAGRVRSRSSPARPARRTTSPLLAFGLVLRSHCWRILFLGADTPIATLTQTAETTNPALVVVSSFDPALLEAQAAALRRLARLVPLALSGPGASDKLCARVGARRLDGDLVAAAAEVAGDEHRVRTARPSILLTGATGYVGGRLLRPLEEHGEPVRCLTRRPEAVTTHRDTTTIVVGDVLDIESLRPAMRGVETAYYLVHSMMSAASFEQEDRRAAGNFAAAALEAGVRRIVYLGGLGAGGDLSSHLSSRQEVGHILAGSGVQTIEFRASIVIGSGSLSFEMLRKLVERLPVMVTPRWVRTKAQPIAIEDVLDYLVAALDVELDSSAVFEIGGADQVSYEELMREYARQLGVHRWIIPVPLLTARLSSLWLGLVTPVYARVGRKLIDSLPHETVVRSAAAERVFPIRPRGYREAIRRGRSPTRTASSPRRAGPTLSPPRA